MHAQRLKTGSGIGDLLPPIDLELILSAHPSFSHQLEPPLINSGHSQCALNVAEDEAYRRSVWRPKTEPDCAIIAALGPELHLVTNFHVASVRRRSLRRMSLA